ncbi:MAG: M1 family aminopeptidase, partial [Desulfatiglandales bacterium]
MNSPLYLLPGALVVAFVLVFMPTVHSESIFGVDISHYEIDVEVSPQERLMSVSAKIELSNPGLDQIELSLSDVMHVEEVKVDSEESNFDHEGNILSIPLNAKGNQTISVRYKNSEPEIYFGDLTVGRVGSPSDTTYMVYRAAWYPMILGDRAQVLVRLNVPEEYTSITVGEHIDASIANGRKIDTWKTDDTIPGVSFAIGNFVEKTAMAYITEENKEIVTGPTSLGFRHNNEGIQFVEISCYLMPKDKALADSCISKSERILKFYAQQFGGYPYQKFSIVEMPEDFFGGHGARGLIMIHPSALMGGYEELFAHEVAHNWWGALISVKHGYNLQSLSFNTPKREEGWQTNDLWLHEGMATYSSLIFLENTRGKEPLENSLKQKRSEYIKSGAGSSISQAEEDYTTGVYHATVYSKGAFVLHMLRYVMGDNPFFELMESYVNEFSGKSVESKDFEGLAEEVHGSDLSWFFNGWIRGKGLPDYAIGDFSSDQKGKNYITRVTISQMG